MGPFTEALLILQAYLNSMLIHEGYNDLNLADTVATLGIFDGVHLGHMTLLNHIAMRADEKKAESVVITFSPHPRLVLDPGKNLTFLTTLEEKKELLAKANIDHLVIINFNLEFSRIRACDFLKDILVGKIGVKHLVIGHDHHFGRQGEGDFETIKKCASDLDFTVEQVGGFQADGSIISSSMIRDLLLKGSVAEAKNLLGYFYSISGQIVEGRKLGRTIGFPTANIKPFSENKLIPGNGVYAVEVLLDNKVYPGMLSIGNNPTVNSDPDFRSIEVHILNFDNNIYGKEISVSFRHRIRDEKKFENLEQLTRQMELDMRDTLKLLA